MAVNRTISFIFSFLNCLSDNTNHPYHSQKMVGMFMRKKNIMNFCNRNIHFFKLSKNPISTSGINHKIFSLFILNNRTSIITFCNRSISRSKYD